MQRYLFARHILLATAAIALIGAAWRAGASGSPAPSPAAPTAVAFVDFARVYKSLKEGSDRDARMIAQRKTYQEELDLLTKRIKGLETDLAGAKRQSTDAVEAFIALQEGEIGASARKEGLERRLSLMQGNHERELYMKFLGTLDFIAQRDGWDAILLDDRALPVRELAPLDVVREAITQRKTLYIAPRADITDQIIEIMNNDYAADLDRTIQPPAPAPAPK